MCDILYIVCVFCGFVSRVLSHSFNNCVRVFKNCKYSQSFSAVDHSWYQSSSALI